MDGVVNVLKPPGMSSSNAVYDVRRIFSEKRAGHLGTLDPGAAGVLPVCMGRATRLFDYLVDKDKTYVFEMTFGVETDTLDAYGKPVSFSGVRPGCAALAAVLPEFVGKQRQIAPVYSALKLDGRKMCDMARAGVDVLPKTREIAIHELTMLDWLPPEHCLLRVRCSRGTYVRSLCRDIARRLGSAAYISMLLRTEAGPFSVQNSYTVSELETLRQEGGLLEALTDCEKALEHLPAVKLPAHRRTAAMNALETAVIGRPDGDVRLYAGGFLGIGRVNNGSVKLTVHLY